VPPDRPARVTAAQWLISIVCVVHASALVLSNIPPDSGLQWLLADVGPYLAWTGTGHNWNMFVSAPPFRKRKFELTLVYSDGAEIRKVRRGAVLPGFQPHESHERIGSVFTRSASDTPGPIFAEYLRRVCVEARAEGEAPKSVVFRDWAEALNDLDEIRRSRVPAEARERLYGPFPCAR
jgi:hypothetical protein